MGVHLFSCQAHGSTDKLPYMTLGSGSLAAMGVLESEFKLGMEKEAAMDLVFKAVSGGVWNDLGSGGSVDLVVMEMGQVCSLSAGRLTLFSAYKGDSSISRTQPTSCQAVVVFVSPGHDKGSQDRGGSGI
jgi:hypothetical protein